MKFKGPAFPSYFNQSTPKDRMQWKRHSNRHQQLRNLRNACRPILNSKDPATVVAVARVVNGVKDEPTPEFGKLHLVFAALDASDQTGESWVVAMNYLMDQFDNMKADALEVIQQQAQQASA